MKGTTKGNLTLIQVLDQLQEKILNNINCCKVGKIVKFYSSDKTADVNICFKKEVNGISKDYPLLLKCPVLGNHITYPIKSGEYCIVLFNDINLDGWFESSNNQLPYSEEKHNLSDGLVICGFNNLINKITDYETERVDITEDAVISGDLEVEETLQIDKTSLFKDDAEFEKNVVININLEVKGDVKIVGKTTMEDDLECKTNIDAKTYSVNKTKGATGSATCVDTPSGSGGHISITVQDGLVTAIS